MSLAVSLTQHTPSSRKMGWKFKFMIKLPVASDMDTDHSFHSELTWSHTKSQDQLHLKFVVCSPHTHIHTLWF